MVRHPCWQGHIAIAQVFFCFSLNLYEVELCYSHHQLPNSATTLSSSQPLPRRVFNVANGMQTNSKLVLTTFSGSHKIDEAVGKFIYYSDVDKGFKAMPSSLHEISDIVDSLTAS